MNCDKNIPFPFLFLLHQCAENPKRQSVKVFILEGYLNDLNAALNSSVKTCGCSHAAKWPPLFSLLK
jgi:hypothetical protein